MARPLNSPKLWGDHLMDVEVDVSGCSVLMTSFVRCRVICNGDHQTALRGSNQ